MGLLCDEDTDFLQAQSNPYRRMAANLYETKDAGRYYHIHGSIEASTTLRMLGLELFRPDPIDQKDIVETIELAVGKFTLQELKDLNAKHNQAGAETLENDNFVKTPHVCCAPFIFEHS